MFGDEGCERQVEKEERNQFGFGNCSERRVCVDAGGSIGTADDE